MIVLIDRQIAWIQAAMGLYRHPVDQVRPFHDQGWSGYRDHRFPEKDVQHLLKSFLLRDPALSFCHQGRHRTTYRINGNTGEMTAVFLKHYQCRKLALYNPRSYLRFGHARKSFRLSHLIAKTGIETPRVLFYLRENRTGPKSDCLLATEGLSGALDLKSWVRNQYLSLDTVEKESFVKELARFISRLHRNGILHGDLESNTLVGSQPYRFYLIDLDSVRIFGSMLKRDRTKQLTVLARRLPAVGADHEMLRLLHQTYWSQFAMRR